MNLTKQCTLQCLYCYAKTGNNDIQSKPAEFWMKLIDEYVGFAHSPAVTFTGGEAMLHPNFKEIVEYSKSKGVKSNIITNGTIALKYPVKWFKDNFVKIKVSLDSTNEKINDVTRGAGAFNKTMSFIDSLVSEGVRPNLMVVVTKVNKDLLDSFREHFGNKVDVTFQPLYSMGAGSNCADITLNAVEYYEAFGQDDYKIAESSSYQRSVKHEWCGMGRNVLSVEADGKVFPCQLLHHNEFLLGDASIMSFYEIWVSSRFRKYTVNDIIGCKECSLKHICGAPCRARSFYALGDVMMKDPMCPDFIERSMIDNLFKK